MTREEAISWLTNEKWTNANNKYKKEWNEAFDLAIEALSADAVQGEWTPFDRTFGRSIWVCSVCKTCTDVPCDAFTQKPIYDYCPNCGAKMKGGDSE